MNEMKSKQCSMSSAIGKSDYDYDKMIRYETVDTIRISQKYTKKRSRYINLASQVSSVKCRFEGESLPFSLPNQVKFTS